MSWAPDDSGASLAATCRRRPGLDGTPQERTGEVLVARYGDAAVTDADREAAAGQLHEHYAA
jgi:hypothetical protein